MSTDAKRRQKKLEKKAAHRKAKHLELTREKSVGLPERLRVAAACPILDCWVSEQLWSQGMGWVCLSRQLPNGLVAFSVFLIDRYCLGVKNALVKISSPAEYDERVERGMRREFATATFSPDGARKLVEEAVAYASALGFHPHPDYHRARLIFGDIDSSKCNEQFEFGHGGKPYFIAGPHDSPSRCQQIIKTLERSCGRGNYDFLAHISPASVLPIEDPEILDDAETQKLIGQMPDGKDEEF